MSHPAFTSKYRNNRNRSLRLGRHLCILSLLLLSPGCGAMSGGDQPTPPPSTRHIPTAAESEQTLIDKCRNLGGEMTGERCQNLPAPPVNWALVGASEQQECARSNGKWGLMGDGCADRCIELATPMCTMALTEACDCGAQACWYEQKGLGTCIPNPPWYKQF